LFKDGDAPIEVDTIEVVVEHSAHSAEQNFANGPLHSSADLRAVGIHELPQAIEHPSAIVHGADKLYMSTQQGKLLVLSHSYDLLAQPSLPAGPMPPRSGSFEGLTLTEYGLLGVDEQGAIGHWRLDDWRRLEEQPLSDLTKGLAYTGIAEHDTQLSATFVAPPNAAIAVANLSRGTIAPLRFGPFVKQGRHANELRLSGITSDGVNLFATTSNYPSIIVIDRMTMATIDVARIDTPFASGISVHGKQVDAATDRVTSDQNSSIYVYDRGEIIR